MSELAHVLRHLAPVEDPNALVHAATGDDAAVYLLAPDRALVITVDFFTPIVDDPFDFGRIGAANAVSDLYAMGATPLFALNLVGFPRRLLRDGLLEEILRGGSEVLREAGVPVLGGHSIDDAEPKFGVVAVGEVHPDRMVTNAGARPGDHLLLTKPLGTGILSTAIKAGAAPPDMLAEGVRWMTSLNREAAAAMVERGVHAATDVTGFGLLGHLRTLLRQSGVGAVIDASAVPVIDGTHALVEAGYVPGGTKRNRADLEGDVTFAEDVPDDLRVILCDSQTSGGLLISAPHEVVEGIRGDLDGQAWVVGEVVEGAGIRVGPDGRGTV